MELLIAQTTMEAAIYKDIKALQREKNESDSEAH
jgi:hypothetical protein